MKVLKSVLYVVALGASIGLLVMTVQFRKAYNDLAAVADPTPHVKQVAVPTSAVPVAKPAPQPRLPELPKPMLMPKVEESKPTPAPVSGFSPSSVAVPMVKAVNQTPNAKPYGEGLLVSWQYYDQQKRGVRAKPLPAGVYWHSTLGKFVVHQRR